MVCNLSEEKNEDFRYAKEQFMLGGKTRRQLLVRHGEDAIPT